MLLLRSLVFDACIYALMAVMGILGAPLALWSVDGAYCGLPGLLPGGLLLPAGDLRPQGRGARARCRRARCWSAAKHQSFLDILILFEALPRAKFIMKKELRWAPILGLYALRIGSTPVNRGDRSKAMKAMVEHAGEAAGAAAAGDLPAGHAGGAGGAAAVQGGRGRALRPDGRPLRAGGDQRRGVLGPAEPLPPAGAGGGGVPASRSSRACRCRSSWRGCEAEVEAASDRLMREAGFEPGPRGSLISRGRPRPGARDG